MKITQRCFAFWNKYIFNGMYFDPLLPYASSLGQWIYLSTVMNLHGGDQKNGG